MISLPSLQNEYTLVFSKDPALDLPEVPEITDASTAAEIAAAEAVTKERQLKLKNARDTGNWPIKSGEKPTTFMMRQVSGTTLSWFSGEVERNQLNDAEAYELFCRIALKSADNCGKFEVKHDPKTAAKPQLVSVATINILYSFGADQGKPNLGRELVMELGLLAQMRTVAGCPPLS